MDISPNHRNRRRTVGHVEFGSIPEEITCTGLRRVSDSFGKPLSSLPFEPYHSEAENTNLELREGDMVEDNCASSTPLKECETERDICTTSSDYGSALVESVSSASLESDDTSDLSDSDSGFSGSNKECLAPEEQWYD